MELKSQEDSKKLKSFSWYYALIGLLLSLNVAVYLNGYSRNVKKFIRNHSRKETDQMVPDILISRTLEGIITMAIKFLNFFIAKLFQFRYHVPLQSASSFMPLLFWVVLTHSVSSLYS
ncbi:Hypothetical predicted protein [Olea europaea subsp. europaea]|uniref:Uncharacterized protein n=1 Tax=Olea europaea subsp. europaea TaxID=158383 RepID=A0A8S0RPU9_OLEEU|nr:Hypothetical predicted protein [Olea europaea subsp. europaea]